ncbi:aspartate aminotransferase family protein [Thermoactinomyces mirandus]|uniref:Aspartate aminotransferase family protein n=1 Tax=Thermoactinomyces mirandus TaxID=2756294 RepID=A0A7W1XPW1_9BACL|nr:aspartate aminotransferase family protein [Thermoactinomyces mirandus]MBA4600986.1 aspartate aminotransferase family protein [Thermoactinomyces mirandus]
MYTTAFKKYTSGSSRFYQEACQWLPGGVSANIKYFSPYPLVMKEADGPCLIDVDGNRYIDYNLSYGALILGHGHPAIVAAIQSQLQEAGTTTFGTPHLLEQEMGQLLVQLYPSIEKVRYTHSGMEAALLAIRLATAWTGKRKIAKFEGHYHGSFDQVLVSVNPSQRSRSQAPVPTADSYGMPDEITKNTLVLPFNDMEQTKALLEKHVHEIGAVILEPVQAGFIPPDPAFLKELRKMTRKWNMVLIFDEVKTGFRMGLSGAQGFYGVSPDLTALGKVLGGGFPLGVVGGRKEIMELCSPLRGTNILSTESDGVKYKPLFHSGTHNGHPLILTAGLTTLQLLKKDKVYRDLEQNTMKLRRGMEQILEQYGLPGKTVGVGSIFNLVMTEQPVRQIQDVLQSDQALRKKLDAFLLEQGIYVKPLNRFSTAITHTSEIIGETLDRFERGIRKLTGKEDFVVARS